MRALRVNMSRLVKALFALRFFTQKGNKRVVAFAMIHIEAENRRMMMARPAFPSSGQ